MKSSVFLMAVLMAVSVSVTGCASKGSGPVKTDSVNLNDTRSAIEKNVKDSAAKSRLLALTTQLEQQVQQLNDFDANGLSRVAEMSANYKTSDNALLQANQTFRIRRAPLQSRIADTLFAMKSATPAAVWPTVGRTAYTDAVDNMVIKKIQPET
ncbi:MAG: hypothetical protein AAGD22_13645 [Verrucomicrobiota bacterium]